MYVNQNFEKDKGSNNIFFYIWKKSPKAVVNYCILPISFKLIAFWTEVQFLVVEINFFPNIRRNPE